MDHNDMIVFKACLLIDYTLSSSMYISTPPQKKKKFTGGFWKGLGL